MCPRIIRTHDYLVEDLGCAWQVIESCLDDTAVGACAKNLGLVHQHVLVAELAVKPGNNIGKVRHGSIAVLEREGGRDKNVILTGECKG